MQGYKYIQTIPPHPSQPETTEQQTPQLVFSTKPTPIYIYPYLSITASMLGSVLPFTEDVADRVSEYCETRSTPITDTLQKHWEYTRGKFSDADKMSSRLQGAWMIFTAKDRKPKRGKKHKYTPFSGSFFFADTSVQPQPVLEIGCFSGYSALAWYEGTKETQAEIVTLELSPKMIAASRKAFQEYGVDDRVTLIEGPADETCVVCQAFWAGLPVPAPDADPSRPFVPPASNSSAGN